MDTTHQTIYNIIAHSREDTEQFLKIAFPNRDASCVQHHEQISYIIVPSNDFAIEMLMDGFGQENICGNRIDYDYKLSTLTEEQQPAHFFVLAIVMTPWDKDSRLASHLGRFKKGDFITVGFAICSRHFKIHLELLCAKFAHPIGSIVLYHAMHRVIKDFKMDLELHAADAELINYYRSHGFVLASSKLGCKNQPFFPRDFDRECKAIFERNQTMSLDESDMDDLLEVLGLEKKSDVLEDSGWYMLFCRDWEELRFPMAFQQMHAQLDYQTDHHVGQKLIDKQIIAISWDIREEHVLIYSAKRNPSSSSSASDDT